MTVSDLCSGVLSSLPTILCLWNSGRLRYIYRVDNFKEDAIVTTLQIGSYSGLDSSQYGIPSGNHIEDRPVYLVYYR